MSKLNRSRLPKPDPNITYEQLIKCKAKSGTLRFIRTQSFKHSLPLPKALHLEWPYRTIFLHKGCIYFYKNETDENPKSESLYGYDHLQKYEELEGKPPYMYAFIIRNHHEKAKLDISLATTTAEEREKWIGWINKEIYDLNKRVTDSFIQVENDESDEWDSDSDYHDYEDPEKDQQAQASGGRRAPPPPPVEILLPTGSSTGKHSESLGGNEKRFTSIYSDYADMHIDLVHRSLSKEGLANLFEKYPFLRSDGTFFVRDSSRQEGGKTLCVFSQSKGGRAFSIMENGHDNVHLATDQRRIFRDLNELLNFYHKHPIPSTEVQDLKLKKPFGDHMKFFARF